MITNRSLLRTLQVLFVLLAGALFLQTLARYVALSSNVMDLGVFLSALNNVNQEPARAFFNHFHPLLLVWGAGYTVLPAEIAPMVLVGLQTLTLIGSVIAVWKIFGCWPGIAMILYYPLWVNALFDFHFDHLTVPLLVLFFVGCEKKRFGFAALAAAALVLVKEPFCLVASACGVYYLWLALARKDNGYSKLLFTLGGFLCVWGALWFVFIIQWVLPYYGTSSPIGLQSEAFSWLGENVFQALWTVLSRPDIWIINILTTPGKVTYLVVVFGLLGFISLLRPAALMVALPLLMISMLSNYSNYYDYANQYTAGLIVPTIVAFRDGLPVAREIWKRVVLRLTGRCCHDSSQVFGVLLLIWLLIGHWALASSPLSRLFWSDKVWSYSSTAYVPTERETMIKRALLEHMPDDPDTSVSSQNTLNWSYLANRRFYMPFPLGVIEPVQFVDWSSRSIKGLWFFIVGSEKLSGKVKPVLAEFVVLDMKRPWFVVDRGCTWLYNECTDEKVAAEYVGWIAKTKQVLEVVFEKDGFLILRRSG